MKKLFSLLSIIGIIVMGFTTKVNGEEPVVLYDDYNLAKSAILIESSSNKVLKEENSKIRLHMASMTKVMSLILIFEALEDGRLTLDQMITTSENAASKGGSQIFLAVGEQMSVDDLIKSICIASANDATVALAEHIAGSETSFVQRMNQMVKKLGLVDTNYANSTGLPTTSPHYTTAYDMAIIASYLINNYPKVLEYTSKYEDYIRKNTPKQFWLVNTNKMVKNIPGVDGLKTGWIESAGYCLTCTKMENGLRLITVVMGSKTVGLRTKKTLELLNYGFSNFEYQLLLKESSIVKTNNDMLIKPNEYHVVTSKDFGVVVPKNSTIKDYDVKIKLDYKKISNYETKDIGICEFYNEGVLIGTVPLNILEQTEKLSFWELFKQMIESII